LVGLVRNFARTVGHYWILGGLIAELLAQGTSPLHHFPIGDFTSVMGLYDFTHLFAKSGRLNIFIGSRILQ
jgi:hypothetical protein